MKTATFQSALIEIVSVESYESPSVAFRELADWLEANPQFELLGEIKYYCINGAHTVFAKSMKALLSNTEYRKMGIREPKPRKTKTNYVKNP